MKHMRRMTGVRPALAEDWQEMVCQVSGLLASMVAAKDANSPAVAVLEGKCDPLN